MEEANHLRHLSDLQSSLSEWQPWACSLAEVADNLGVDPSHGLDRLDAHNRRTHLGPNVPVDLAQHLSFLHVFLEEAAEPMMLLLLAVGILYSIWGEPWDAATIFIAIIAVVGLEAFTEWRALHALVSLRNSVPTNTSVLREDNEVIVPADELVPGDVIMLSQGQSVPADAVVVVCHGFSVDESALTGESIGNYKAALNTPNNMEHNLRLNEYQGIPQTLVCAGTTVTTGRAVGIVVATGPYTQIAFNIAKLIHGSKPPPTPSQRRMRRLAGSLSVGAIIICVLITLVGLAKGIHWRAAILMGMSLAFATIPEEMPLIAKASLALCSRTLARHGLLVRKLNAADSLSEVSVIITDKTGTLTRNQLIVSSIMTVSSTGAESSADLSVEVITPEAVAVSEKSAALAAPLYSVWSLSVDPLESRPLVRLLKSIRQRAANSATHDLAFGQMSSRRQGKSTNLGQSSDSSFVPLSMHGFGKDFMNSAVLQSLPSTKDSRVDEGDFADSGLPRDPDTGTIPAFTLTEAISLICEHLPEPTGELAFDPALRISARTRSAAKIPVPYVPRAHDNAYSTATGSGYDGDVLSSKNDSALSSPRSEAPPDAAGGQTEPKHWTVVKGAPEVLIPHCNRIWASSSSGVSLSADDIRTGNIDAIRPMPETLAQSISRSATDLAVGGNRIIAYAMAITSEPLFSGTTSKIRFEKDTKKTSCEQAYRFGDSDTHHNIGASSGTATAVASTIDIAKSSPAQTLPCNMIFVGAFAFFDPPQREARPVLQECQEAGIRVIVATGDHPSTALAVANAVGIAESQPQHFPEGNNGSVRHTADVSPTRSMDNIPRVASERLLGRNAVHQTYGATVSRSSDWHHPHHYFSSSGSPPNAVPGEVHAVTGEMIQHSLNHGTFDQLIDESNVFARITPAQKLRLVHALQARGEVVAFIGDGINDAPALLRADVGICMGGNPSTADVAMDAASLIVLSGKFSKVVRSLRQGYRQSVNMKKCMEYYIACKLAIVLLFVFLLLAEGASPLTPVQVIFIELFVDLGATWTFLTAKPEGIVQDGGELEATLAAQTRVCKSAARSAGTGYLGSDKATDYAVLAYGLALFATCTLPLLVPSLLLPYWAVAPVAPTLTFFTWMAAHVLLAMSMQTQIVPLRIRLASGWRNANIPGTIWIACSLLAVVLSAAVRPIGEHLGIVPLNAVEWVIVVLSPLLLITCLEIFKEAKFKKYAAVATGNHNSEQRASNAA